MTQDDVLARVPAGPPCPTCNSTLSVEALSDEVKKLRTEKRRAERKPDPVPGNPAATGHGMSLAISSADDLIEITDRLTCANCGAWFMANAREKAIELRNEIRELKLELHSAVDLLGEVGDDE